MISDFDSDYTAPEITERQALLCLHECFPTATIEPQPGNPNIVGMHLFKVFNQPSGIPQMMWVHPDGRVTAEDDNLPLAEVLC